MSDRIDELVATVRGGYPWQEYPSKSESHVALTELATIARKHEANRMEALRQCLRADKAEADRDKWIDRCYQSDERADKAEAMRWQWERAAMEADVIVDDLLNNQRQGDYEPYHETSLGDNLIVFKRIIAAAREAVAQK